MRALRRYRVAHLIERRREIAQNQEWLAQAVAPAVAAAAAAAAEAAQA